MKVCFTLVLGHRYETCTLVFYRGVFLNKTVAHSALMPHYPIEKMVSKKTCAPPFYRGCFAGGACTPTIYIYKMWGHQCTPWIHRGIIYIYISYDISIPISKLTKNYLQLQGDRLLGHLVLGRFDGHFGLRGSLFDHRHLWISPTSDHHLVANSWYLNLSEYETRKQWNFYSDSQRCLFFGVGVSWVVFCLGGMGGGKVMRWWGCFCVWFGLMFFFGGLLFLLEILGKLRVFWLIIWAMSQ